MKKRNVWTNSMWKGLLVTALTVSLFVGASSVYAAVTCPGSATADADGDGIMDAQECAGIVIANVPVPKCAANQIGDYYRAMGQTTDTSFGCLNPDKKDLFVIIERDSTSQPNLGSLIPYNKALDTMNSVGVVIHEVPISAATLTASGYRIFGTQNAIKIKEFAAVGAGGGIFGEMPQDTMTTARVYTGDIRKYVNDVYADTNDHPETWVSYIKYVLNHELGHGLNLKSPIDRKLGYHYANSTSTVMQQTAVVSTTNKTFFFPIAWGSGDATNMNMK